MGRLFIAFIVVFFVCGCSAFGHRISGSVDKNVRNYSALKEIKPQKHVVFKCDFNKSAIGPAGENFCSGNENADYVSYFTSITYQVLPETFSDYVMNLAKQLELDGKISYKTALSEYSSQGRDGVKSMNFDKMDPLSFALDSAHKIAIFISKKDIFLRNRIYPSLKLLSLTAPNEADGKDTLSDYRIKYSIYPHTISSFYSTNWLSSLLGIPKFTDAERIFDSGEREKVLSYFSAIEKQNNGTGSENIGAVELARPFVFSKKIASAYIDTANMLKPSPPESGEGFINEYLPSFSLEKVEIVRKSVSGEEVIIRSWNNEDIAELIENPDETAGFFFSTDKFPSGILSIRFTHKAQEPRYSDEGLMRAEASGIAFIYSSIGETIVTDLDIAEYFPIKALPVECIKDAGIIRFLEGSGFSEQEIAKAVNIFTDTLSSCSPCQLIMTKVIFARNADAGGIIR